MTDAIRIVELTQLAEKAESLAAEVGGKWQSTLMMLAAKTKTLEMTERGLLALGAANDSLRTRLAAAEATNRELADRLNDMEHKLSAAKSEVAKLQAPLANGDLVERALRRQHSEKPPEFRDDLVRLLGDVPRVELFNRHDVPGWVSWGDRKGIAE